MTIQGSTICNLIQSFPVLLILAQNHNRCLKTHFVYKPPSPTHSPEYYEALDALFHNLYGNGCQDSNGYGHQYHYGTYGKNWPSEDYTHAVSYQKPCHNQGSPVYTPSYGAQGYPVYGYKKANIYNISAGNYGAKGYAPNQVYSVNNKYKVVVKKTKKRKTKRSHQLQADTGFFPQQSNGNQGRQFRFGQNIFPAGRRTVERLFSILHFGADTDPNSNSDYILKPASRPVYNNDRPTFNNFEKTIYITQENTNNIPNPPSPNYEYNQANGNQINYETPAEVITVNPQTEINYIEPSQGSVEGPINQSESPFDGKQTSEPKGFSIDKPLEPLQPVPPSGGFPSEPLKPVPSPGGFSSEPLQPVSSSGGFSSEPLQPVPSSGGFSLEPLKPVPSPSGFSSEPLKPIPSSGGFSSESLQPVPSSGGFSSGPLKPVPSSGGFSSEPLEPAPSLSEFPLEPLQPVQSSGGFSLEPLQPVPSTDGFSSKPLQPAPSPVGFPSESLQPVPSSGGFSSEPLQPVKSSGGFSLEPIQPVPSTDGFSSKPLQPTPSPVGFSSESLQPVPSSGGFSSEPLQPVQSSGGFSLEPLQPVPSTDGFSLKPLQPAPSSGGFSSVPFEDRFNEQVTTEDSRSSVTETTQLPELTPVPVSAVRNNFNFGSQGIFSETCQALNGDIGSCISIYECPFFLNTLKKSGSTPALAQMLRKAHCGFEGNAPKVCCPLPGIPTAPPPAPEVITTTTTTTTHRPITKSAAIGDFVTVFPDPPECGLSNSSLSRVVGGYNAKLGDFPWMALLGYKSRRNSGVRWLCGGTLITSHHVLTAAHCIHGHEDDLYIVRLGELDLAREDEGAFPVDALIKTQIPHEGYDSNTYANDIAVLVIDRDVSFSDLIRPICMPQTQELRARNFVNYNPFIAGWGDTEFRGLPATHLQVLQLPVVSNDFCANAYRNYKAQKIDSRVLCAGYEKGGKDACQGDSGGPLMQPIWNSEELTTYFYQIGVVSFGRKCAEIGFPGVYTRVTHFIPWLEKMVLGVSQS